MSLAEEKIKKAMRSSEWALSKIDENKRRAVGDLDYAEAYIQAAKHILIAEIKEDEGKF